MTSNKKPLICITLGDPSGIGPEVIVKSLLVPSVKKLARFIIVGDSSVVRRAVKLTGADFKYKTINITAPASGRYISATGQHDVLLLDLANIDSKKFKYGCIKREYGKAAIDYINTAYSLIKSRKADAMVTGPINKCSCKKAGFRYYGHTEFLACLSKTKNIAMMLTGGPLSVVLATTHLALADAVSSIKKDSLYKLICLIDEWMRVYFGVHSCKIGVCGLNPHAGEGGVIGSEENKIIIPAVKKARSKGINVSGPYPSDGLFHLAYNGDFNLILCMYHDQGLIPVKMIARNEAVNITLGLPFIRTSPAHGTAFDIAGKGLADPGSFSAAINTAASMAIRFNHGNTLQYKKVLNEI